jgi:hypothetical protein
VKPARILKKFGAAVAAGLIALGLVLGFATAAQSGGGSGEISAVENGGGSGEINDNNGSGEISDAVPADGGSGEINPNSVGSGEIN